MKSYKRSKRVADQMKRDLSEIIEQMFRDREGMMITVSFVKLSDDLRHAKVFYTLLGDEDKIEQAQAMLEKATGRIQTELAHKMRIRRIPEITMQYDTSLTEGMRMTALIDEVMGNSDKSDAEED